MLISSSISNTRSTLEFVNDIACVKTGFFRLIALLVICLLSNYAHSEPKQHRSSPSILEHQQAANYTHVKWPNNGGNQVKILRRVIINRSGVPLTSKTEQPQEFNHSSTPLPIDSLFESMLNASQYFLSSDLKSDYQLELIIDQYQLPFDYSAGETWWQSLTSKLDQLFSSARDARITLSMRLSSNKRHIPTWQRDISVSISECELNQSPQSLVFDPKRREELTSYARSTIGQSFIAASNFLILQAIEHINNNGTMARVDKVNQNDLLLVAQKSLFSLGEKLPLYHNNSYSNQTRLPVGSVQVIKTFENQALAYPIDLSIGSIKVGDWVKVNNSAIYLKPSSIFDPVTQCELTEVNSLVENS